MKQLTMLLMSFCHIDSLSLSNVRMFTFRYLKYWISTTGWY